MPHILVEQQVSVTSIEPGILVFYFLEAPDFRRHQTAIAHLPVKECRLTDAGLAAGLGASGNRSDR
jgi:hypothetical protein